MCYEAGRRDVRHANMAMPPLAEVIQIYETMANVIRPSRVIGISANTRALDPAAAEREVKEAEDRHGLPATDVVRYGAGKLVDAVLEAKKRDGAREGPPRSPRPSGTPVARHR
jgi:uncharacterized NAD-dependent epimerase/dehydratase family protein